MILVNRFKILLDTCFWIALYNNGDQYNEVAERIANQIEEEELFLPFPSLYEFINSKFSRNRELVFEFENLLSRPNVHLINDSEYLNIALENFFRQHKEAYTDLSLIDEVIKLMLSDRNMRIDYFVTFDEGLMNFARSQGIRSV